MDVVAFEPPEPNTDKMVTFLHWVLENSVDFVAMQAPFTTGDLMGAALYLVVESGLQHAAPDKLRSDIIGAIDRILEDEAKKKQGMN